MEKLSYIPMTMGYDRHKWLQVGVVLECEPLTMPAFHMGYLWTDYYTLGMIMGNTTAGE